MMRRLLTSVTASVAVMAAMAGIAHGQAVTPQPPSAVIGNVNTATDPANGTVACGPCIVTPFAASLNEFGTIAPFSGIVTEWEANVTGPGTVALVVMTPVAGSPGQFTVRSTSAPQTLGDGAQFVEFATSQPIMQGDTIGLQTTEGGAQPNFTSMPLNGIATAAPPAAGTPATVTPYASDAYLLLDVTVVRAPIVQSVSPSFGPATGGTQVTLTGQNLDQAASVTFNGVAAQSFTVVDEQTIQAVAPAAAGPGLVTVQASNASGLGTGLASGFAYNRVCTAPNLRGKSIAAARRAAQRANCALGAIRRTISKGKRRRPRIVSQSPAAGTTGLAGLPVTVVVAYNPPLDVVRAGDPAAP